MKCLALALVLCTQLHLIHGGCYGKKLTLDMIQCQDFVDKTWHPIGSSWRNSACQDCNCERCCDAFSTPRSFPDDCMMEFDKEECEYKVFKKNDRTQPCQIFKAVGK
ncbi:hypothetical protein AAFF_G00388820 [Aldrovandia affinis]|uniref:Beta-microseminoprotein n=1 Tax=Aldrovandia affinis TaxID=143900 RepID=A0AAD7SE43_9TELE|nr:hypothetical protein AAFF_G00388820 [Aldrovandia affinis]